MPDKSKLMFLDALGRAVREPAGVSLFATRTNAGLFPTTSAGKQAAQRCKELGYLDVRSTEFKGKSPSEVCAITEKGLAFLLSQVNPRQVLEDLVHALGARQAQVEQLVSAASQTQATLAAFKTIAEKVLHRLEEGSAVGGQGSNHCLLAPDPSPLTPLVQDAILSCLAQWQAARNSEDCPLPELLRRSRSTGPGLSLGQFHDGLRVLHEHEQIYLHPWTGPLYDLPEPACAMLVGHEIVYYGSLRQGTGSGASNEDTTHHSPHTTHYGKE